MVNRSTALCFIIAFSMVCAGCDKIPFPGKGKATLPAKTTTTVAAVKGTVIAKINNVPVTLQDLNEEIESYNTMVPADKPELKITSREQKTSYLKNEMVRRMLLYQNALDKRLDTKEEVLNVLEKTKMDLLVMQLVKDEAEKVDVSSKEIEDYYNTYKDRLRDPEERSMREIMVTSEPEAKDILIQLLQGADFATLAKDRSKAPSAKNGGDVGFIKREAKFAQYDNAAFADSLEVGKFSNIFKGTDGYYILKLEGKRGGEQKSLNALWDDIKRGLTFLKQQKKIEDLVSKLSQDAKLEFYEGEIK